MFWVSQAWMGVARDTIFRVLDAAVLGSFFTYIIAFSKMDQRWHMYRL